MFTSRDIYAAVAYAILLVACSTAPRDPVVGGDDETGDGSVPDVVPGEPLAPGQLDTWV